jgi:hypothetical protein
LGRTAGRSESDNLSIMGRDDHESVVDIHRDRNANGGRSIETICSADNAGPKAV